MKIIYKFNIIVQNIKFHNYNLNSKNTKNRICMKKKLYQDIRMWPYQDVKAKLSKTRKCPWAEILYTNGTVASLPKMYVDQKNKTQKLGEKKKFHLDINVEDTDLSMFLPQSSSSSILLGFLDFALCLQFSTLFVLTTVHLIGLRIFPLFFIDTPFY